jgi:hypothetical protein
MSDFQKSMKERFNKAQERDRQLERPVERISRLIWPWSEAKLVLLVSMLALLDFISTVTALKWNVSHHVQEVGWLAKWAFNAGGFPGLFFVYAAAIGLLVLFATGVRALYIRSGHIGFGRSAFVFLFVPYTLIIIPIVINNFMLTFAR